MPFKGIQTKAILPDVVAVLLIIIAFSWICFRNLEHPGPYGDEAWASAPAIRFLHGARVINPAPYHEFHLFGRAFPYMANDYIGPIQVYVIWLFFALFGISVPVMRIATSVVGILGLLAMYLLVRREFGRLSAGLSTLLVATDLTYVLAVRHDFGVISFGLPARMLALYFFLGWWRARERVSFLFLSLMTLGLALTYRFDYLSFVAAAVMGMILFYGLWLRPRMRLKEIALALSGFFIGAFPILLYNYLTGGRTFLQGRTIAQATGKTLLPTSLGEVWPFLQSLPEAVAGRMKSLFLLTEGTGGNWILNEPISQSSPFGASLMPWAVTIAVPLLIALMILPRFRTWRRPLGFLITVFVLTLILIAATPIATGPHHILSLYPWPHMLVGITLGAIWHVVQERPAWLKWTAGGIIAIAMGLMLVPNLALAQTFHTRLIAEGGDGYCSEAIYDLAATLKSEYAGKKVLLLDWGFEEPLIVVGKDQIRQQPVYWRILGEETPGGWLAPMIRDPNNVFVIRAEKFAFNATIHKRFKDTYLQQHDLAVEERKFFRKTGTHVFSILTFRVQKSNLQSQPTQN